MGSGRSASAPAPARAIAANARSLYPILFSHDRSMRLAQSRDPFDRSAPLLERGISSRVYLKVAVQG